MTTSHVLTIDVKSLAPAASANRRLTILIALCWLLSAVCIASSPGTPAAGIVGIYGVVKAASRILALVALGGMLISADSREHNPAIVWRLMPLVVFAAWAIVSTLWSPMTAVTLTHAVELMMLALLSMTTAFVCRKEQDLSRLLCHMVIIIALLSAALLLANRELITAGIRPNLYMQPNNMAAIAVTGLITLAASRVLWNWRWTRTLFWPATLICGTTILLARSRSCILVAALVMAPILWKLYKQSLVVATILVVGVLAAAWPYSAKVSHLPDGVVDYLMRGQSAEDAYTVSGRTELWSIALDAIVDSPVFGHGYYVMNSTGSFRVWGAERWQTAHNTYLHVITGTGVIGLALMTWALLFALSPAIKAVYSRAFRPKVFELTLYIVAWCVLLGSFELSFAGPIDPMVLLFFILLGCAAVPISEYKRYENPAYT